MKRIGLKSKKNIHNATISVVCCNFDLKDKYDLVFDHEELNELGYHKITLIKKLSNYVLVNNNWSIEYIIFPLFWNKYNSLSFTLNDSRTIKNYNVTSQNSFFNDSENFYETIALNILKFN